MDLESYFGNANTYEFCTHIDVYEYSVEDFVASMWNCIYPIFWPHYANNEYHIAKICDCVLDTVSALNYRISVSFSLSCSSHWFPLIQLCYVCVCAHIFIIQERKCTICIFLSIWRKTRKMKQYKRTFLSIYNNWTDLVLWPMFAMDRIIEHVTVYA